MTVSCIGALSTPSVEMKSLFLNYLNAHGEGKKKGDQLCCLVAKTTVGKSSHLFQSLLQEWLILLHPTVVL